MIEAERAVMKARSSKAALLLRSESMTPAEFALRYLKWQQRVIMQYLRVSQTPPPQGDKNGGILLTPKTKTDE